MIYKWLSSIEPLLHGGHYTTMACLLPGPLADTATRGLVLHMLPPMTGEGPAALAAHEATSRSYVQIGEYGEIDGRMGTVEKISIRSMQLRPHRGPVHTIPYGEVPKLTNFSRDWVIMKLRFTVNFNTDPNKVKKVFKKIGADMMEDPLYREDFLQPFKSQGVFDFDDVGMVIRGKFMTKPGKQFMIRKELYNRIQAEFAANGIEFARREVRVALPDKKTAADLSKEEIAALASAATAT